MYYLGVDGGGSVTLSILINEYGDILGRGIAGNGNHQVDRDEAAKNIRASTEQALAAAGLTHDEVSVAVFGLAGADRPIDFVILEEMLNPLGYKEYEILCDTDIALYACSEEGYGIVSICGTGTNCLGISPSGERFQCGGFGYNLGDFGGGSELKHEVLRSVIRAWEGRGLQTELSPLVLEALGYESVEQLFDDFLDHGRETPGVLTKLLDGVEDDEVTKSILERQGSELALAINAVAERLKMHSLPFRLVLAGSVLTKMKTQHLRRSLEREVYRENHHVQIAYLDVEPVLGSLLKAMRIDGHSTDHLLEIKQKLSEKLSIHQPSV